MQTSMLSLVLLLVGATGALADDMKKPVNASQIEWAPAPNFVPAGAQIAVLSGDPSKDLVEARVDMASTEAEKLTIWETARQGAAYKLGEAISTNLKSKDRRAVTCSG
jgi:hypothetical protein